MSPAEFWMGTERPQRMIYVTKLAVHRWMKELFHPAAPVLLYGCGGLPSARVCGHVRATQRLFRVAAFFLGDLDPGDLSVLLALTRGDPRLSSSRQGTSFRYAGVGDQLLELIRRRLSAAQFRAAVLDMNPGEKHHFSVLQRVFSNIEDVVGSESLRILERGKKIEMEGILRWAGHGTKLRTELSSFLLSAL